MKSLEYYADISFNSFLFPNIKDTRKILGFLFEIMFKDDEEEQQAKRQQEQPTNTFEARLTKRLHRFKDKPWVIPEFLKGQPSMFPGSGDVITTPNMEVQIDDARVAACKSKKVKGIAQMMKVLTGQG